MREEENFKNKIEEQKVIIWKNNYINYDLLKTELDTIIEKNKKDIKKQVKEMKEIKEISPDHVEAKQREIRKNIDISAKEEKLVIPDDTNEKKNKEKKIIEVSFNKLSKNFLRLLNKEVNSFIDFFKSEENQLYKQIILQITNYTNSSQKNEKNIEIINEFEYLSNLCKELMNYVYLNIIILVRILNIFDNMFTKISYDYIKKYLSDGKLTHVLKFKIIDKCLVSIEDILTNIEEKLNQTNYFKNNKIEENKYIEKKNIIFKNIKDSNDTHEKIFIELKNWEKYLNIKLELPISNNDSIFTDTSFIGDPILSSGDGIDRRQKKIINYFEVEENNDDNNENDEKNDKNDLVIQSKLIVDFGVLFDQNDTISYKSDQILSSHNSGNLQLIRYLAGFYSYSYILLVPDIIIIYLYDYSTFNNYSDNSNILYKEELYLYGIAISIPLIGNIIAKKLYKKYFYKYPFKNNIITSLIFVSFYYILCYLAFIFNKNILNIIFIIIGRFLLGLSNLKQISKIYEDNFVPRTNLLRANEKYNYSINIGYIIGLLINFLGFFDWKRNDKFYSNLIYASIVIGLSFNFGIVMLISICIQFKEINNNVIEEKEQNIINRNENEDENNLEQNAFLEGEKEVDNNEEKNEKKINHLLSFYINKNTTKKKTYFKKIVFILLFNLFTSQYISENLLLLLPRLLTYNFNDKKSEKSICSLIIPLLSSIAYLISYIFQRMYLKNSYFQSKRLFKLIFILIFMIIFSMFFSFLYLDLSKLNLNPYNIFPTTGFFTLITTNELYHSISNNYFIDLLPTENFKLGNFSASAFINIITKIARLIPSFVFLFFFLIYKIKVIKEKVDDIFIGENSSFYQFNKFNVKINICNSILFGLQLIFLVFNLILVISFKSYLKNRPINRLLSQN